MKTLSTKKIIIISAILIVVLIAGHFVVFGFIKNSATTVSTLERDINSLQAQAVEFSKYSPEDLKKLAESVNSRIISHTDFVSFIEKIEATGRVQNVPVIVRSVNVEPRNIEDTADDKEIMRLKLETTGTWENTQRYINYLEHLPYKIAITNLGLSILKTEGKASSTPTWRGQIELTALKFK